MKYFALLFILSLVTSCSYCQQNTSSSLGSLTKLSRTKNGLLIETTYGKAQVTVYSANIIRVRIVKDEFEPDFSYAFVSQPAKTSFKVFETEGLISLITDSLRLDISTGPVRFLFLTKDNLLLNKDDTFETNWVDDYGIFFDNSYKSRFDFGAYNRRFSSFDANGGEMNYYFIYGSSIREILKQFVKILTDRYQHYF